MTALVRNYLEIKAYRQAFALQQRIYQCSRRWPAEEVTALTSRILRAARDIGARLSHAWAIRADDVEFVEVAELDTVERHELTAKDQMKKLLFRLLAGGLVRARCAHDLPWSSSATVTAGLLCQMLLRSASSLTVLNGSF